MDKTKIAVDIFNKYAAQYQDRFMDVGLYKVSLDFFCEAIQRQNAEILELACGPGNITKYLLDKRPDLKILGTDLAPNMIELAKQNNPSARFEVMDCRHVDRLKTAVDAIVCGFCLPYLTAGETQSLLVDCAKLLSRGGLLYISTMEDDYEKSGFKKGSKGDEIFMHFYREKQLAIFLSKAGLKIIFSERKDSFSGNEPVIDLILIAEKV